MAIKRTKAQLAYGMGDTLIPLTPLPVIAVRNPTISDRAELGTMWVNKSNNTAYVITSIVGNVSSWIIIT
jgi:hypothetical protein